MTRGYRAALQDLAASLRARERRRSAPPPPSPARTGNPFQKNAKGERNVTAIMAAIKANPARARRLCQEAREPLSKWFPNNPR